MSPHLSHARNFTEKDKEADGRETGSGKSYQSTEKKEKSKTAKRKWTESEGEEEEENTEEAAPAKKNLCARQT